MSALEDGRFGVADRAGVPTGLSRCASQAEPLIPSADGSNWTCRTVRVWEEYKCGAYRAFKLSFHGDWHLERNGVIVFSDENLQSIMGYAQGIEAGTVETAGLDPKDESPVGGSRCAPTDGS